MNYDQAYAAYSRALPDELRQEIFHGGWRNYRRVYRRTVLKNLERRVHDLLHSICAWRLAPHYLHQVSHKMLGLLTQGMIHARNQASVARDMALLGDGGNRAADQDDIGGNINPHHQSDDGAE